MIDLNENFETLSKSELKEIGGGWFLAAAGLAVAVYGAVLAGAAAKGYADGKDDCP